MLRETLSFRKKLLELVTYGGAQPENTHFQAAKPGRDKAELSLTYLSDAGRIYLHVGMWLRFPELVSVERLH